MMNNVLIAVVIIWASMMVLPSSAMSGLYGDSPTLDQSIIFETLPRKEQMEMQQEILTLLGLHHRPRKPKSDHVTDDSAPKYMLDLYKSFSDDHDEDFDKRYRYDVTDDSTTAIPSQLPPLAIPHTPAMKSAVKEADVIMSFINHAHDHQNGDDKRRRRMRHDRDRRFWFDVSEVSVDENILAAQLRLFRQSNRDKINSSNYTITVFQILHNSHHDRELEKLDSIEVLSHHDGWLVLNVTNAVSSWVIWPHTNYGLYVTVTCPDREKEISPSKIGIVGHKGPKDSQAFMTAFFKTSTQLHVRRTRAASSRRRQKKQSSATYSDDYGWNPYANFQDRHSKRSCQKRTLYVSFRDLGWQDWIIAPDGYAAFYCNGECSFPLNAHMNATNHAIVQTLVHLMNPYTVPKPCCAPNTLSAISVLYFDDNSNVILKKYKNMVVKSCGCH